MNRNDTPEGTRSEEWVIRLAGVQGLYYLATGILPLVSMRAFEAITGPKVDKWLVKTVGLLISVVGGTLVASAGRRRIPPEIVTLGAGSAAAFAAIDFIYPLRGRISKVYMLDGLVELGLVAAWIKLGRGAHEEPSAAPQSAAPQSEESAVG
jgi:uncharacterized membrane protein